MTCTVERTRWISTLISLSLLNEITTWAWNYNHWIRDINTHIHTHCANSNPYAMPDYIICGRNCLPEKKTECSNHLHTHFIWSWKHISNQMMYSHCSARLYTSEKTTNILLLRSKNYVSNISEIFQRKNLWKRKWQYEINKSRITYVWFIFYVKMWLISILWLE